MLTAQDAKEREISPHVAMWDQQNQNEMAFLVAHMASARSMLEIGSCYGQSLQLMAIFCWFGAKIRSIDLGVLPAEAGRYSGVDTSDGLRLTADELRKYGFDVELYFGDSHKPETCAWASQWAPYDFVFIDGDHAYEGVKQDWENYGSMADIVGFHDIANKNTPGVVALWEQIKADPQYETAECVASQMGIGVVRKKPNAG